MTIGQPSAEQPKKPTREPELFDDVSDKAKADLINKYHLFGDAIKKIVARNGMLMVGNIPAEDYFAAEAELFKGNDNSDMYKN